MKQYLDKDQTAKLIELGFPKPRFLFPIEDHKCPDYIDDDENEYALVETYSIGELIEFLPHSYSKKDKYIHLDIFPARSGWFILYATYNREEFHRIFKRELVEALFCACVTLKEEGVI